MQTLDDVDDPRDPAADRNGRRDRRPPLLLLVQLEVVHDDLDAVVVGDGACRHASWGQQRSVAVTQTQGGVEVVHAAVQQRGDPPVQFAAVPQQP